MGERQLPLDALNLPLYSQGASPEIQIIPPEGQDLAPAQAGSQLQQEQFKAAVLLGLDQQALDLLSRQHLHLFGAGDRRFAGEGGIFQNQPLGHRLIQRHPAGHMTALYHAVGQPRTVLLHPQEPASLLQPVIELLEVRRDQFGQRDGTQLWDDVLVDAVFIVRLGLGTNLGFALPLIPVIQPGTEGHVPFGLLRLLFLEAGLQCFQLCTALRFGFCQYIFRFGEPFFIVAHHDPAFPAAFFSQVEAAVAPFPSFCHKDSSSPNHSVTTFPTISAAFRCISPVTWV